MIGHLSYFGLWANINNVVISHAGHKSLCTFLIISSGITELKDTHVEILDKLLNGSPARTCLYKTQIWSCRTLWLVPLNQMELPAGAQGSSQLGLVLCGPFSISSLGGHVLGPLALPASSTPCPCPGPSLPSFRTSTGLTPPLLVYQNPTPLELFLLDIHSVGITFSLHQ